MARQIADLAYDAFHPAVVIHLSTGVANVDDNNSMLAGAGAAVLFEVASCVMVRPAFSSMMTTLRRDHEGRARGHRACGFAHTPVAVGLALLTILLPLARAIQDAWGTEPGAARNRVVLSAFEAALKLVIYTFARGVLERFIAPLLPAVSIIDSEGDEVSPELTEKMVFVRAVCMLLLTVPNAAVTLDNILQRGDWTLAPPFDGLPGSEHVAINLWVGVYEFIASIAWILALATAARAQHWSLSIGDPDGGDSPSNPTQEAPDASLLDLPWFIPGSILGEKVREAVASIRVQRTCASVLRGLFESRPPYVFRDIMGFRWWGNLMLLALMSDRAMTAMEESGMPFGPAGWLGLILGVFETAPLLIERGINAQVSEGNPDRDLVDKLHRLFRLQDEIYRQRTPSLSTPHPDEGLPIIDRTLHRSMMELIAGNPVFDDVRRHMRELKRIGRQRQRMQVDRSSERLIVIHTAPIYPPPAMREQFGNLRSRDEFLPDSRVMGQMLHVMDDDE